ncbi:universal stress protein [Halomarina rubra]|uniref:Universal stress protein n=1 Tax=Halomarina rubra TaxID=2071873 RepID=A0ABD6ARF9_9EURY|nr:universal stress protein [Halomarina rubra]
MQRALVVADSSEASHDLVREAGELAAGVDASLLVLATLSKDGYERDQEILDTIASSERTTYQADSIKDHAQTIARNVATEELTDIDVDYETRGVVLDGRGRGTVVVEEAETADCDHVFIAGVRRSPTGKAVFGDTTQSVILNFDGRTTVAMADDC